MNFLKKIILPIVFSFLALPLLGQFYKDIATKLDFHAGGSFPITKNYPIKEGFSATIEPKFWYNEKLVFGARLGASYLQSVTPNVRLAPYTNIHLLGEKYFDMPGDIVPFTGVSAGYYFGGNITKVQGVKLESPGVKALGYAVRGGLQLKQVRLLGEYHRSKGQWNYVSVMLGYQL
jgi:hypothetical protein